ncbi:phosphotransferase family protein [Streptomyces hoynatensis]|uniref:Aminoglycoside phosphotransferase family protein n=1 Tax=Streptomyces hoynatensis TaxID=1141874 RepID=A0A3A9YVV7_9ACTN|nr:aminoglycoside phosphotransferase family protein [Streptomyces hoynatensis]RKN39724.1 aminoglycoside phosphotransferase family protein [Streptomyces hoynatensis]
MRTHEEGWPAYVAARGYPGARPLAAGMEGAVYALDGGLVAKVWGVRSGTELERLRRFYEALGEAVPGLATPRIVEVLRPGEAGGPFVTIERRLTGAPLGGLLGPRGPWSVPRAAGCLLDVHAALSAAGSPALRGLAVLDEPEPFWAGHGSWPAALLALIDRRTARFGARLSAAVPGFEGKLRRLRELVGGLGEVPLGLLHGDLVPDNVLAEAGADGRPRVTGVLDFGFLSTVGDPAFDAAVTAGVFDMYGPRRREAEALLDAAFTARFGYPPERLVLYRAVYGLITANAYDPEGRDGHFGFCADLLNREDTAALLGP